MNAEGQEEQQHEGGGSPDGGHYQESPSPNGHGGAGMDGEGMQDYGRKCSRKA